MKAGTGLRHSGSALILGQLCGGEQAALFLQALMLGKQGESQSHRGLRHELTSHRFQQGDLLLLNISESQLPSCKLE